MSHVRCLGMGALFGLLAYSLTAHGADAPPVDPSAFIPPGAWPPFIAGLGTTLGVIVGRAGGLPFLFTIVIRDETK